MVVAGDGHFQMGKVFLQALGYEAANADSIHLSKYIHRGTSLTRKIISIVGLTLGLCPVSREVLGGCALSYEPGTPVAHAFRGCSME